MSADCTALGGTQAWRSAVDALPHWLRQKKWAFNLKAQTVERKEASYSLPSRIEFAFWRPSFRVALVIASSADLHFWTLPLAFLEPHKSLLRSLSISKSDLHPWPSRYGYFEACTSLRIVAEGQNYRSILVLKTLANSELNRGVKEQEIPCRSYFKTTFETSVPEGAQARLPFQCAANFWLSKLLLNMLPWQVTYRE